MARNTPRTTSEDQTTAVLFGRLLQLRKLNSEDFRREMEDIRSSWAGGLFDGLRGPFPTWLSRAERQSLDDIRQQLLFDIAKRADVSIAELVQDLARIKAFDVRKLFGPVRGPDGEPQVDESTGRVRMRLLEPWDLDDDTAAALDGVKLKDTKFGLAIEYKSAGKLGALELLAKYKGMLKEPEKPPIVANIQISF